MLENKWYTYWEAYDTEKEIYENEEDEEEDEIV